MKESLLKNPDFSFKKGGFKGGYEIGFVSSLDQFEQQLWNVKFPNLYGHLRLIKKPRKQTFQMMCVVFFISWSWSLQDSHALLVFVQ